MALRGVRDPILAVSLVTLLAFGSLLIGVGAKLSEPGSRDVLGTYEVEVRGEVLAHLQLGQVIGDRCRTKPVELKTPE